MSLGINDFNWLVDFGSYKKLISKSIFRYSPICDERIFEMLSERKLYSSKPESFNDPFDCNTGIICPRAFDETPDSAKLWRNFLRFCRAVESGHFDYSKIPDDHVAVAMDRLKADYGNWVDELSKEFQQEVSKVYNDCGVLSCTSDPLSILMWSLYADHHKGIVWIFDIRGILSIDKKINLHKVSYSKSQPTLSQFMNYIESNDSAGAFKYCSCIKHEQWQFEKEYRIFTGKPGGFTDIGVGFLKGVIFGLKTPISQRINIIDWLEKYGWNDLSIYEIDRYQDRYALFLKPFDVAEGVDYFQ